MDVIDVQDCEEAGIIASWWADKVSGIRCDPDDEFDRIDQDGHNPTVYWSWTEMKAAEKEIPFTDEDYFTNNEEEIEED